MPNNKGKLAFHYHLQGSCGVGDSPEKQYFLRSFQMELDQMFMSLCALVRHAHHFSQVNFRSPGQRRSLGRFRRDLLRYFSLFTKMNEQRNLQKAL